MVDQNRQSLLSDKMVSMWAKRFLSIRRSKGPKAAKDWADRTLNKEDIDRISKEIQRLNGTGTRGDNDSA